MKKVNYLIVAILISTFFVFGMKSNSASVIWQYELVKRTMNTSVKDGGHFQGSTPHGLLFLMNGNEAVCSGSSGFLKSLEACDLEPILPSQSPTFVSFYKVESEEVDSLYAMSLLERVFRESIVQLGLEGWEVFQVEEHRQGSRTETKLHIRRQH